MPETGSKSRCTTALTRGQQPTYRRPAGVSPSLRNSCAVIRSIIPDSISAATNGSRLSHPARKRNISGAPIRNTAAASSGRLTASAARSPTTCLPRSRSIRRFLWNTKYQLTQTPAADKTAGADVWIFRYSDYVIPFHLTTHHLICPHMFRSIYKHFHFFFIDRF